MVWLQGGHPSNRWLRGQRLTYFLRVERPGCILGRFIFVSNPSHLSLGFIMTQIFERAMREPTRRRPASLVYNRWTFSCAHVTLEYIQCGRCGQHIGIVCHLHFKRSSFIESGQTFALRPGDVSSGCISSGYLWLYEQVQTPSTRFLGAFPILLPFYPVGILFIGQYFFLIQEMDLSWLIRESVDVSGEEY